MAINGIEKAKLTRELKTLREKIKNPATNGIERVKLTKQYRVVRDIILSGNKSAAKPSRLDKLKSGDYDNQPPEAFIGTVREIVEQEGASIASVKPPVTNYVEGYVR